MKQELHQNESSLLSDTTDYDYDEEDGEYENDSLTFNDEETSKRRCAFCKYSPLKLYEYHGFNVLYCEECKKEVCKYCRYPGVLMDTASGLSCTKCGASYPTTST